MELTFSGVKRVLRTETEISGARFHRAGHVENVPHIRKTTVITTPVLTSVQENVRCT